VLFRAKIGNPEVDRIQQALQQRGFRLKFVDTVPGVTLVQFSAGVR
jgi:hypothetical protein